MALEIGVILYRAKLFFKIHPRYRLCGMADAKRQSEHMEKAEAKDCSAVEVRLTDEERRLDLATLLRLDLLLMPMTLILYLLAWLDRANVGNARIVSLLFQCIDPCLCSLGWSRQRPQSFRLSI